ncbi:hypothetical protein J31TS4_35420 [Paenibacillus sp. J31TS4]|uniref:PCYCGC domain-containing protein n=1 Tax=Paenibacillus sp. J31TS4 TaxID=2807195 RepID=UPI001B1054F8|nr:PCYCGC domain-containing protein [Paenibacillus sp. J31TS4]GIP40262.1 hypothetical protein J31TS4_35420 [Paenibacillus sp. J31TS4]
MKHFTYKRWTALSALLLALAMLTAACGGKQADKEAHAGHEHAAAASQTLKAGQTRLPNGDLQETTDSLKTLPSFLNGQQAEITAAYRVAAATADLLDYIPCYCGCGQSAGHKSNKNCFISEVKSDGTVVWDDHGTRCDVCINIAVMSAKMKEAGKTYMEIRTEIDKAFGKGYAAPTKTPLPM